MKPTLNFSHVDGKVIDTIEQSETTLSSNGGGITHYSNKIAYTTPIKLSSHTNHWQKIFIRAQDGGEFTATIHGAIFARKGSRLRFFYAEGTHISKQCLGVKNLDTGDSRDFYGMTNQAIQELTITMLGYMKLRYRITLIILILISGFWLASKAVSWDAPSNEKPLRELIESSTPIDSIKINKMSLQKLLLPTLKGNELRKSESTRENLKNIAKKLSPEEQSELCSKFFNGTKYQIDENGRCAPPVAERAKTVHSILLVATWMLFGWIVILWIKDTAKFQKYKQENLVSWEAEYQMSP